MDTKIFSRFWSDPQIEILDSNGKLAVLWLLTAHVTDAGYVECSRRRFEFETGSPWQALLDSVEALGDSIVATSKGFWFRNYIRLQIGVGQPLAKNNMAKSIARSLRHLPDDVHYLVLQHYPELKEALGKPSPTPYRASESTGEERRGEERRGLEGSPEGNHPPPVQADSVSDLAWEAVQSYCRGDAPNECHALVMSEFATGTDPAEVIAKIRECTRLIEKHAAPFGGRHNGKVPRAKSFFTDRQWNDPLVFQHRWEGPEKKESGAVFVKPPPAPKPIPPPPRWEDAAQSVLGYVPDSWDDLPGSTKADVIAHRKTNPHE